MDREIKDYIKKNSNIDKKFIEKFYNVISDKDEYIKYADIQDWVGYKHKKHIVSVLKNPKYQFIEGTDYKMVKQKSTGGRPGINILIHIDTAKMICLMVPTTKGHQFRKYYIEMDKLFKKYVSTKLANKLNNPVPELNKHDFDINKYKNKEILYLIHIKDNLYKFGITSNLRKRLRSHKKTFNYNYVVKCWDCTNRTVSTKIENNVKNYIKYNNLRGTYNKQTEIIETDDIMYVINIFNTYVDKHNANYEDHFKNKHLEQELNIIKSQIELFKTMNESKNLPKNINFNISLHSHSVSKKSHTSNCKNPNKLIEILNNDKSQIEKQIKTITKKQSNNANIEDPIDEILKNKSFCKRCKSYKLSDQFGTNKKTKSCYKQCIKCREEGKISDDKRRKTNKRMAWKKVNDKKYTKKYKEKRENAPHEEGHIFCKRCRTHKPPEDFGEKKSTKKPHKSCIVCRTNDRDNKKKQYDKGKEKILERNRQYYQKNKDNIIEHKKDHSIQKQFEEHNDTIYCKGCRSHKPSTEYGINKKTKKQYNQCKKCRNK
uniref:Uncharacterized protein n=1 Tax=Mimivirus LCMiAC01 TaxID=2506608 RepID=A0A481Z0N9_9VIRU|nr:MAG: hypothetical protein LCMiAC01_03150 [Mimivirus LCMiAC01]